MLNLITNVNMDQVIAEKLLSFILFDIIQQQQQLHNMQQYIELGLN